MSHIATIRQRIKAIQTIQKTTSAMRLIAMSLQGRLRKKESLCAAYRDAIARIRSIHETDRKERKGTQEEVIPKATPPLTILIGSQKGLCGTFNEQIFT